MASWFASAGLPSGLSDALTGLADKVQSQVNSIDPDLIKKLTLQSEDLVAERNQIDDEERRKEAVRDNLSEILPWETRDSEMEILVDECREVILGLSSKVETFTGPYILEGGLSNGKEGNDINENDDNDNEAKMTTDMAAAEASSEKLAKLQPLPELLANFDLDSHVGLIQRLLQVDTKLVDMQMRLSSGGERELIFWKNYFFHCAYTRYEAGLSIDEIWSNEPRASRLVMASAAAARTTPTTAAAASNCAEDESSSTGELIDRSDDEIVFDSTPVSAAGLEESGKEEIVDFIDAELNSATIQQTPPQSVAIPSSTESEQYEFVSSGGFDGDDGLIDELEAEILAALDD